MLPGAANQEVLLKKLQRLANGVKAISLQMTNERH